MYGNFSNYNPIRSYYGPGELKKLHTRVLPGKKALLVTGCGKSVKKYGYLDTLINELKLAGVDYVLFDKVRPNPLKEHVMEAAALAKKEGCDFVIGFGGGSSLDSSKSIAIMATNPGDYWDYVGGGSGKGKPVPVNPLPIVAITTTAGTGSELDQWSVISNGCEKIGFGYDKTFPVLSIVDPELTLSIPSHLTAYQGFDALFHATEGYIANIANPLSEIHSIKSIELIGKYLPIAVADGKNMEARANMILANSISGMVEVSSTCTSEHSIEHALSAYHPGLTHGAGLILLSEAYYTHFIERGACPEKFVAMAKALGKTDASKPLDFVEALVELQKKCNVHGMKMSDWELEKDLIPKYAKNARECMGGLFNYDPVPITDAETEKILENCNW